MSARPGGAGPAHACILDVQPPGPSDHRALVPKTPSLRCLVTGVWYTASPRPEMQAALFSGVCVCLRV